MRILITNDDSVNAEQLIPLVRWCQQLGEVTVVVPRFEQSGKSHGIEFHAPFKVEQTQLTSDISAYVVDSTPADCVRFAVLGMEMTFDLVISGINRGFNIGADMLYSGTVSAAREAALLGIPGIAFSTSPENYGEATVHLSMVWEYMQVHKLWDIHTLYNVNIPPSPKGIRITRQGGPYFSDSFDDLGDDLYLAHGKCVFAPRGDTTLDTETTLSGFISIMPLTVDMTDQDVYTKLTT